MTIIMLEDFFYKLYAYPFTAKHNIIPKVWDCSVHKKHYTIFCTSISGNPEIPDYPECLPVTFV